MNNRHRTILRWLTVRLAAALETAPALDPFVPLADLGVDSVHAVSLAGEIETTFDIDVEPTLIFDYPTLSHIAEFISRSVAQREPHAGEAVA